MEPINFKEANAVFAKDQKQYLPLPAHVTEDEKGIVTSCWKLTFGEALRILFTRKLWHRQMGFGKLLQPVFMTVNKKDIFNENENKDA